MVAGWPPDLWGQELVSALGMRCSCRTESGVALVRLSPQTWTWDTPGSGHLTSNVLITHQSHRLVLLGKRFFPVWYLYLGAPNACDSVFTASWFDWRERRGKSIFPTHSHGIMFMIYCALNKGSEKKQMVCYIANIWRKCCSSAGYNVTKGLLAYKRNLYFFPLLTGGFVFMKCSRHKTEYLFKILARFIFLLPPFPSILVSRSV